MLFCLLSPGKIWFSSVFAKISRGCISRINAVVLRWLPPPPSKLSSLSITVQCLSLSLSLSPLRCCIQRERWTGWRHDCYCGSTSRPLVLCIVNLRKRRRDAVCKNSVFSNPLLLNPQWLLWLVSTIELFYMRVSALLLYNHLLTF